MKNIYIKYTVQKAEAYSQSLWAALPVSQPTNQASLLFSPLFGFKSLCLFLALICAGVFLELQPEKDYMGTKKSLEKKCAIEEVNKFSSTIFFVWPHCTAVHTQLFWAGVPSFLIELSFLSCYYVYSQYFTRSLSSKLCAACFFFFFSILLRSRNLAVRLSLSLFLVLALWLYLFFPLCA